MIIQITPRDIIHGTSKHCTLCPVARALQRVSIDTVECHVTQEYAYGLDRLNRQTVWESWLPTSAKEFIYKFDKDEVVKSIEFELAIPEKLLY